MARQRLGDRQEDDLCLRKPHLASSVGHGNVSYSDHVPQNFVRNKVGWRRVSQGKGGRKCHWIDFNFTAHLFVAYVCSLDENVYLHVQ